MTETMRAVVYDEYGPPDVLRVAEVPVPTQPPGLTFAEASTIPQAGAIALQGTVGASDGSRMLVNGGGGGSGSFAIQQAKRLGAHVTGVDNAGKLDHMRSLGADEVIDFQPEDFTRTGPYDLILDLVASRSVFANRGALARGGRYRCVGGPLRRLLGVVTLGWIVGGLTGRRMGVLVVREGPVHFEPLADLCVAGDIRIPIDRPSSWPRSPKPSPTSVKTAPSGRSSSRFTDPSAAARRRRQETRRISSRRVDAGGS